MQLPNDGRQGTLRRLCYGHNASLDTDWTRGMSVRLGATRVFEPRLFFFNYN